jgi:hypothetical protein
VLALNVATRGSILKETKIPNQIKSEPTIVKQKEEEEEEEEEETKINQNTITPPDPGVILKSKRKITYKGL